MNFVKPKVFKVFVGCELGVQWAKFEVARCRFETNTQRLPFKFIYLTTTDIRERNLTEKEFVDFFLDCDIHIFLSHPLQGQTDRSHHAEPRRLHPWDAEVVLQELNRLKCHKGYPHGNYFHDGAFTQDKLSYISLLQQYTIPTHCISLRLRADGILPSSSLLEIEQFISKGLDEGYGYVLKLPFTTNSKSIKFPKNLADILDGVRLFHQKYRDKIHYAILQPCLANRKENRFIFLNGKFSHIACNAKNPKPSIQFGSLDSRTAFAVGIMSTLLQTECFLSGPMVRLDIMCYKGNMVLNEIESLEALYEANSFTESTGKFLEEFWYDALYYFGYVNY